MKTHLYRPFPAPQRGVGFRDRLLLYSKKDIYSNVEFARPIHAYAASAQNVGGGGGRAVVLILRQASRLHLAFPCQPALPYSAPGVPYHGRRPTSAEHQRIHDMINQKKIVVPQRQYQRISRTARTCQGASGAARAVAVG